MISKYLPAYLTDGVWSPIRAGLFFVSRTDGWINAYDMCYKINDSAFSYKVCDVPLTSIAVNYKGDKLLIGDESGKVSVIKLSKSFYVVSDNEYKKEFLGKLFDRESTREKNIEIILKKRNLPIKDETAKLTKQEQQIKDRIKNIESLYMPFVSEIFNLEDHQKG